MSKTTGFVEQKWIVYFLFAIAITYNSEAQKVSELSLAAQTESIAIPFTRLTPMNPGVELGATLRQTEKLKSTRRWNAYLGWFYHENFDQNFYLRGEYQFSYSLGDALEFFMPIGLGYMHSFHPKPVYEQRSDGSFEEKSQTGMARAIVNLGIGLSYSRLNALEPFVKYEVMAQSPFVSTVPVAPRTFLKIGTNFKLN